MNKKLKKILLLSTLIFLVGCTDDKTKVYKMELYVSAAASTKEVMEKVQEEYKKIDENVELIINYGSSGSLQQQIEQGAPCDIVISAGKKQVEELNEKGLLVEDSVLELVQNELVLISSKDSSLTSIDDLKNNKVKHIGIGEPNSVPAGLYAKEVIDYLNMEGKIKDKLVYAKDVKEVLAWVQSSNAEAGFVYYTDVYKNEKIKIVERISSKNHSPITYPIAITKNSKNISEAKKLEDFLLSERGQKIFKEYGYKNS